MDSPHSRPDHYALLGVQAAASPEQITSAYRALVRILHPDARAGRPAADEELAEVVTAYRVLHDPQRRAAYDAERERPPSPPPGHRVRVPVRVRYTTESPAPPSAPLWAGPVRTTRAAAPAASAPLLSPLDHVLAWLYEEDPWW
ncbi:J domain-containing protein [Streptomyces sp. NPDC003038]|uniref:J domain-containing protein n=1 Tax=unclassified Streptomyces TaxID=2593676 RepID=UPI0033A764D3